MNRILTGIFLLCAMLCKGTAVAQDADSTLVVQFDSLPELRCSTPQPIIIDTISCVNFDANAIIFNGADWAPLFQSMEQLQDTTATGQKIVTIVHLGDSHVQAGFFTEAMRIPMQAKWGNAGRGLITPLKITKTNEPFDYRFTSPEKWQYNRCLGKRFSSTVGVGGILIEPLTESIDLNIETMSLHGEDVKFNRLRLLHTPADSFPLLQPTDEPGGLVIRSPFAGETCYSWDSLVSTISLHGTNNLGPSNAAIYGAALENGSSGVIIHSIGNNSATYECYNRIDDYGKKLAALTPNLVIISLGTNESVYSTFSSERLEREIDRLISAVREENPDALLLLTTPAENMLRKRKKNKRGRRVTYYANNANLPRVAETIREYGARNCIAVWDWYAIAGGKGACETWIKEEGMKKDHIHYTQKGYTLQGSLLYHSILNAYEQYIR